MSQPSGGRDMCERGDVAANHIQRGRDYAVSAGIVVGGLLMVCGSIYGIALRPGGPEELETLWPFYLGGVIAILLGRVNGNWR
jgi:hypothetical protein